MNGGFVLEKHGILEVVRREVHRKLWFQVTTMPVVSIIWPTYYKDLMQDTSGLLNDLTEKHGDLQK